MGNRLTTWSKWLRKNATDAESLLWYRLRNRQLEGIKFRRQQPIENYIVDFVSFEKGLVIELDGGQHADAKEIDMERDTILAARGFTVLRFWNNKVLRDSEGVLEVIREACLR